MNVKLTTTLIVVRKMCEIKIYETLKHFNYYLFINFIHNSLEFDAFKNTNKL